MIPLLLTLDPAGLKRLVSLLRSLILRPSLKEMVPCGLTEDERVCGMGVMSSMERLIPRRLRRLPTYSTTYLTIVYTQFFFYIHSLSRIVIQNTENNSIKMSKG